jgi:hypothetical protein
VTIRYEIIGPWNRIFAKEGRRLKMAEPMPALDRAVKFSESLERLATRARHNIAIRIEAAAIASALDPADEQGLIKDAVNGLLVDLRAVQMFGQVSPDEIPTENIKRQAIVPRIPAFDRLKTGVARARETLATGVQFPDEELPTGPITIRSGEESVILPEPTVDPMDMGYSSVMEAESTSAWMALERMESLFGSFHFWIRNPDLALMESLWRALQGNEVDAWEYLTWLATDKTHPPRYCKSRQGWIQAGGIALTEAAWRAASDNPVLYWYSVTRNQFVKGLHEAPQKDALWRPRRNRKRIPTAEELRFDYREPQRRGVQALSDRVTCERVATTPEQVASPEFVEVRLDELERSVRSDVELSQYVSALKKCSQSETLLTKTTVWRELGWGAARGERVDRKLRRLVRERNSDTERRWRIRCSYGGAYIECRPFGWQHADVLGVPSGLNELVRTWECDKTGSRVDPSQLRNSNFYFWRDMRAGSPREAKKLIVFPAQNDEEET